MKTKNYYLFSNLEIIEGDFVFDLNTTSSKMASETLKEVIENYVEDHWREQAENEYDSNTLTLTQEGKIKEQLRESLIRDENFYIAKGKEFDGDWVRNDDLSFSTFRYVTYTR